MQEQEEEDNNIEDAEEECNFALNVVFFCVCTFGTCNIGIMKF